MNDHQRKMARKAGAACGYENGGGVRGTVSDAIESVGRFFGTEKAKKIDAAGRDLRENGISRAQEAIESNRSDKRPISVKRVDRAEDEALRDADEGKEDTTRGMTGVRMAAGGSVRRRKLRKG